MLKVPVYLISRISPSAQAYNAEVARAAGERFSVFVPHEDNPYNTPHQQIQEGVFRKDLEAMLQARFALAAAPFGTDCAAEAGWFNGEGKPVIVFVRDLEDWLRNWMVKGFVDVVITDNKDTYNILSKDPILSQREVHYIDSIEKLDEFLLQKFNYLVSPQIKQDELIDGIDQFIAGRELKPIRYGFDIRDPWYGPERCSRFIHGNSPADLIRQKFDSERLISVPEVMALRVKAFEVLVDEIPELLEEIKLSVRQGKYTERFYKAAARARDIIETKGDIFNVWKVRLTTSSHMVRDYDDTVFFNHRNPFNSDDELANAMNGQLSDGGIKYTDNAIETLRRSTPASSRITYQQYMDAKGGNFSGRNFLNHPIFSTASGDNDLMKKYTTALQCLSLLSYYHNGKHSGWRPGEMKVGYGRPISLGAFGDAFYPPNNSTVDHSALLYWDHTKDPNYWIGL